MATVKQLQKTLQLTFGLVPIIAGFDKFTNLLTHWANYLGPNIKVILPIDITSFMQSIGLIEILAGAIVFFRPLIGAYIVMGWLISIALVLIIGGNYYDVAVRDLVMAIGAFTLAQLTQINRKSI